MILDLRAEARKHAPRLPSLPALRRAARETWRGRMINEHGSGRVFDALVSQLSRAGFDDEDVAECARFAGEERTHGVLCGAVVEALGGEARAPIADPRALPEHRDVSLREAALRNVISSPPRCPRPASDETRLVWEAVSASRSDMLLVREAR